MILRRGVLWCSPRICPAKRSRNSGSVSYSHLDVYKRQILHRYDSADVPTNVPPGQNGEMVVGKMTDTLAFYGQFIVPLLLLAGAVSSFLVLRKREGLVRDVAGDKAGENLRALNWSDFELLVGEAFRMRGFSVTEAGGGGPDGGIDLELRKEMCIRDRSSISHWPSISSFSLTWRAMVPLGR